MRRYAPLCAVMRRYALASAVKNYFITDLSAFSNAEIIAAISVS
jgi:hypothetical protein